MQKRTPLKDIRRDNDLRDRIKRLLPDNKKVEVAAFQSSI